MTQTIQIPVPEWATSVAIGVEYVRCTERAGKLRQERRQEIAIQKEPSLTAKTIDSMIQDGRTITGLTFYR